MLALVNNQRAPKILSLRHIIDEYLAFQEELIVRRTRFDLKKAPNVTRVYCSRADEETVLRWVYTHMRRAGVSCDTECCERIMRYCLGSMSRIAAETEKLIAYAGEGG